MDNLLYLKEDLIKLLNKRTDMYNKENEELRTKVAYFQKIINDSLLEFVIPLTIFLRGMNARYRKSPKSKLQFLSEIQTSLDLGQ